VRYPVHVAPGRRAFAFVATLGALLVAPREARLTIDSSQTLWLSGMRVTVSDTIGCETTHDYPSDATVNAAEASQKKRLAAASDVLVRAYQHFLTGTHPWTRDRQWLAQTATPLTPSQTLEDDDTQVKNTALRRSVGFSFGGTMIELVVKPDAPSVAVERLPFEFLLAQVAPGGVFGNAADRDALGLALLDREALNQAQLDPNYPYAFCAVIASAANDPSLLRPETDALPDAPQARYDESLRRARIAALASALGRAPLDATLDRIAALPNEDDRALTTRLLILLSPLADKDRAALRVFCRNRLGTGKNADWLREEFGALLQP